MPLFANRFLLQTLPQSPWRGAVVVLEDGDKVGGVVIATEARQLRGGDVCLKQDVVGELHTVLYKPQVWREPHTLLETTLEGRGREVTHLGQLSNLCIVVDAITQSLMETLLLTLVIDLELTILGDVEADNHLTHHPLAMKSHTDAILSTVLHIVCLVIYPT